MKNISLLIFIITASACTSSKTALAPDTATEHTVNCSGTDSDWDTCHEQATEICGEKGYDEVQKYEDIGAFAAYDSARVLPDRRLIFQCKE